MSVNGQTGYMMKEFLEALAPEEVTVTLPVYVAEALFAALASVVRE